MALGTWATRWGVTTGPSKAMLSHNTVHEARLAYFTVAWLWTPTYTLPLVKLKLIGAENIFFNTPKCTPSVDASVPHTSTRDVDTRISTWFNRPSAALTPSPHQ